LGIKNLTLKLYRSALVAGIVAFSLVAAPFSVVFAKPKAAAQPAAVEVTHMTGQTVQAQGQAAVQKASTETSQKAKKAKKKKATKPKKKKRSNRAPVAAASAVGEVRYASIVIDAQTGRVLSSSRADELRYPASLTKMMTLYMVFDALEKGELTMNERLYVSQNAAAQSPSKLGLRPGSTITVHDAILSLITKSANDASVVLAEKLGRGSEARFARQMTEKARALGMSRTTFANPNGLPNPRQVTTARDMATLSLALINDFPEQYRYFSTPSFTFNGVAMRNHNRLMATYDGMDGIKTGYIHASGFNLAASAARDNHRLVAVVFGGRTATSRNEHMKELLDEGFAEVLNQRTVIASRPSQTTGTVTSAATTSISTAAQAQSFTAPSGAQLQTVKVPVNKPQPASSTPAPSAAEAAAKPAGLRLEPAQTSQTVTHSTSRAPEVYMPRTVSNRDTGVILTSPTQTTMAASSAAVSYTQTGQWAVQIGAFTSENAGARALMDAVSRLPHDFKKAAKPHLVTLETSNGLIYRARLAGFDKNKAADACRILKDGCMIMATR
jgi:D-alanyl-D-alanine carboxypeptidase